MKISIDDESLKVTNEYVQLNPKIFSGEIKDEKTIISTTLIKLLCYGLGKSNRNGETFNELILEIQQGLPRTVINSNNELLLTLIREYREEKNKEDQQENDKSSIGQMTRGDFKQLLREQINESLKEAGLLKA